MVGGELEGMNAPFRSVFPPGGVGQSSQAGLAVITDHGNHGVFGQLNVSNSSSSAPPGAIPPPTAAERVQLVLISHHRRGHIPVSQINLDILYSKVLGNIRQQGTMQGLFVVCSDRLTVVFPIVIGAIYEWHGPVPSWSDIIVYIALSLSLCIILRHRLVSNAAEVKFDRMPKMEIITIKKGDEI
ncbi:hypothetical protein niasHS_004290 [Heterodera schachtii]|uniref:Uncharacterized protein n=1 Tax=Heterodera schachtii TaxID=97005 RepID=A0ABD2JKN3_HETSC